jgi:hypothetical protein
MTRAGPLYTMAQEQAHELAAKLTARVGRCAFPDNGEQPGLRVAVAYVPTQNGPHAFGVVERWRYADRPELGDFGGRFLPRPLMLAVIDGLEGEGPLPSTEAAP